jgi:hypothetical protein
MKPSSAFFHFWKKILMAEEYLNTAIAILNDFGIDPKSHIESLIQENFGNGDEGES